MMDTYYKNNMDEVLKYAIENNCPKLIKIAIDNGASIDKLYETTYQYAIKNNYIAIAKAIIDIRKELKRTIFIT